MKKWKFFLLVLCSLSPLFGAAQNYVAKATVELTEFDGTMAVFRSEGYGASRDATVEEAKKAVFGKLIYEGVEDINDGNKLLEKENDYWLSSFFKDNTGQYKGLVTGVQVENTFDRIGSDTHCYAIVIINYNNLLRTLRTNGIMGVDSNAQPTSTEQPDQPKKPHSFRRY